MAYWVKCPGVGAIRPEKLLQAAPNQRQLQTRFSGISPGTERLVGLGRVPREAWGQMACRHMGGSFQFPIKYGYSLVGTDPDGEAYFTMHPHQTNAVVDKDTALPIPTAIPLDRAVMFPAMETALNAVWDAGTIDSSAVVGGGLIGILIAYVEHQRTGQPVTVIETDPRRRVRLTTLEWVTACAPDYQPSVRPSVVFHCSASSRGLQWAIDNSGFEASIIEVSWFGDRSVEVSLGNSFHYERKRIISSQVAFVAAPRRGKANHSERAKTVLALMDDPALDDLLTPRIPFEDLPNFMKTLYEQRADAFAPVVEY